MMIHMVIKKKTCFHFVRKKISCLSSCRKKISWFSGRRKKKDGLTKNNPGPPQKFKWSVPKLSICKKPIFSSLTLSYWLILHAFSPLLLLLFLSQLFSKKIFPKYHQCQTLRNQIKPRVSLGLILVQTFCTGYQQT